MDAMAAGNYVEERVERAVVVCMNEFRRVIYNADRTVHITHVRGTCMTQVERHEPRTQKKHLLDRRSMNTRI